VKPRLHRGSLAAFILGLCVLCFLGGAAAIYYRAPGTEALAHAFEGGRAWYAVWAAGDKNLSPADRQAIADLKHHPKITWDAKRALNGYTLISLLWSDNVYLVDMKGHVVHEWNMPFSKAWPDATHVHSMRAPTMIETAQLLPNGDLIAQYYGSEDTPYGYGIAKMDKDSHLLWTYSDNAHHNFYIDRTNGDIYGLVQKMLMSPAQPDDVHFLHYPMLADYIVRLSKDGKEQERISLLDAFRDTKFALLILRGEDTRDAVWDYMHSNSVVKLERDMAHAFPMFKPGQLLVSLRNMSVLAVIDPGTKKVVWAMSGGWKRQHSAAFAANGHIILFDNQGAGAADKSSSRAIEIDPATGNIVRQFPAKPSQDFVSVIHGRVQPLANGNMLVVESDNSRLWEITTDGKVAWKYALAKLPEKEIPMSGIVSAVRYTAQELPFLQDVKHEAH